MTRPMVKVEIDQPLARLTLDRPERHNSLVPDLLEDLIQAVAGLESDQTVEAVILSASGKTFSTGGDVGAFYDNRDKLVEYANKVVGLLNESMLTMMNLPKPIIAGVHGMVTGGSMGLVLASDLVVVTPEASFTPWYSVVGFAPDGGWSALLPRHIGQARTADILLSNRTITAQQAVDWGLASRIVDADQLDPTVESMARSLAAAKTSAIKRELHGDLERVAVRLDKERSAFVRQVVTEESINGMREFLRRD